MQLIYFLSFFLLISTNLATLVNVTIDDELGDPVTGQQIIYLPGGAWNIGPRCKRCRAKVDANQTLDGTWHDGTFNQEPESNNAVNTPLSASIPFYGSAIYVYCILANGNSDMTFLIDSQIMGTFYREPEGDAAEPFEYNSLVFFSQSLIQGDHMLTIVNGHIGGPKSLLILDYIIYSHDDGLPTSSVSHPSTSYRVEAAPLTSTSPPQSTPPPANPAGKIIGVVLGSIACLLLILVAFLFRRQQKSHKPHELPVPASTSETFLPGEYIRRWFQKSPFNNSPTNTHFSFNPSLLVLPIRNHTHSHSRAPSLPPAAPHRSKNQSRHTHHLHRPPDTVLLAPLPPPTTNRLSPSILDTHTHLAADSGQPLSITEWRRRTQQEADATPPQFDMSEVDLSSYYESDSYHTSPPARPPPKPTIRRFTVVNN